MAKKGYVYLAVRPEAMKQLMVNCKEEYLKHHSDMKDTYLSQHKMLMIVTTHYLITP